MNLKLYFKFLYISYNYFDFLFRRVIIYLNIRTQSTLLNNTYDPTYGRTCTIVNNISLLLLKFIIIKLQIASLGVFDSTAC